MKAQYLGKDRRAVFCFSANRLHSQLKGSVSVTAEAKQEEALFHLVAAAAKSRANGITVGAAEESKDRARG